MTQTPDSNRLDRIEAILEQVAQQQQQLGQRFDSLVFETQRILNSSAGGQTRMEAAVESLAASVARLTQRAEADLTRWESTQAEIRQIWQYLLSQRPNGSSGH